MATKPPTSHLMIVHVPFRSFAALWLLRAGGPKQSPRQWGPRHSPKRSMWHWHTPHQSSILSFRPPNPRCHSWHQHFSSNFQSPDSAACQMAATSAAVSHWAPGNMLRIGIKSFHVKVEGPGQVTRQWGSLLIGIPDSCADGCSLLKHLKTVDVQCPMMSSSDCLLSQIGDRFPVHSNLFAKVIFHYLHPRLLT